LRHLDVQDDDVGAHAGEQVERHAPALSGGDLVRRLEEHAERLARSKLVVDDEDAGGARRHGGRRHATAGGSDTTKDSSCRCCRTRGRPPSPSPSRWPTPAPTSMRLSCTICTGSKSRSSLSADTAAVREPTTMRTSWPPLGSVWRPIDSEIFARSLGEL